MTDVDTTDIAAEPEPAAEPYVHPLPAPPADGSPSPEEWLIDYLREEFARAGRVLTDAEFESAVELNRLRLLYPGEYVVYREHPAVHAIGWGIIRHEVLFHSPDWDVCERFFRSQRVLDEPAVTYTFVDEPNVIRLGGAWVNAE